MIPWTQPREEAVPRPRTGVTPIRHVRVPERIWSEVARIAREDGRTMTGVVLEALDRYLAWHKRQDKRGE